MRPIPLASAAVVLLVSGPSFAQEWIEYIDLTDLFTVNFPTEPEVRDIAYPTEYGITLPGRIHSVEDGPYRYSVTVVQYANVEAIHAERLRGCQAYPNLCNNPWIGELRGALDYAAWGFPTGRHGDALRVLQQRPSRGTSDPTHQRRSISHLCCDPHAPESPLCAGGNRATRWTPTRVIPAVARIRRRGGDQGSLRGRLLERVPAPTPRAIRPAGWLTCQMTPAAAKQTDGSSRPRLRPGRGNPLTFLTCTRRAIRA